MIMMQQTSIALLANSVGKEVMLYPAKVGSAFILPTIFKALKS